MNTNEAATTNTLTRTWKVRLEGPLGGVHTWTVQSPDHTSQEEILDSVAASRPDIGIKVLRQWATVRAA
jgi:hypothetical protein